MASRPVVDIASGYPLEQWKALTDAIMKAVSNNQLRKRNGDSNDSDSGTNISSSNEYGKLVHFDSDSDGASLSGDSKSEEISDSNHSDWNWDDKFLNLNLEAAESDNSGLSSGNSVLNIADELQEKSFGNILTGDNIPQKFNDVIEVKLDCMKGEKDVEYGSITITAEEGGKYNAYVSAEDIAFFKEWNACTLHFKQLPGTDNKDFFSHALCMIRNSITGVCEIFDPNGPIDAYGGTERARYYGIMKAINMGLLRGLISPNGNTEISNVSFQNSKLGLQLFEFTRETELWSFLHSGNRWSEPGTIRQGTKFGVGTNTLATALNNFWYPYKGFGFCVAWSTLKFFSAFYSGMYYNALEDMLINDIADTKWDKVYSGTERWVEKLSINEDSFERSGFHKFWFPCAFVRLLSAFIIEARQLLPLPTPETGEGKDEADYILQLVTHMESILGTTNWLQSDAWNNIVSTKIRPVDDNSLSVFLSKPSEKIREYVFSVNVNEPFREHFYDAAGVAASLEKL